jgi:quercetin dioxygenase-like cupin family protein
MRTLFLLVSVMVLTLVSVTWAAEHVMVEPKDLKWEDVSAMPPGAKVAIIEGPLDQATPFIARFKFPADFKIPAHWHPAIEHVTVLSGTLHMGIGDKLDPTKTRALPAGSVSIIPAKTNHFAWAQGETVVQVHGVGPWGLTYVDPADDPRKK